LQAMVNDPLVHDLEKARAILDGLLAAHEQYLPQFNRQPAHSLAA
jgi:alpha-galactosidase/6-phospho-beta-glucosidase family protein